jgi:predicted GNAT family N-acyltransferase
MAVLLQYRKQGIGSQILQALVKEAKQQGAQQIQLHAQVSAIPFYAKHDFESTGPIFDEVGINHVLMTLEF